MPRIVDLEAIPAATSGKVEIETLDEGRDGEILANLVRSAVLAVFKERVPPETHRAVVDAFEGDLVVDTGEDVTDEAYANLLQQIPAVAAPVQALLAEDLDGADCPHFYLYADDRSPQPYQAVIDRFSEASNWQLAVTFGGHELPITNPEAVLRVIDIAAAGGRLPSDLQGE